MKDDSKQTFVIGDVHGHLDRLKALYEAAEIDLAEHRVIQLGDLGHYGITGNRRADADTWEWAYENVPEMLWGNHDAAVIMPQHIYTGYQEPFYETQDLIKLMVSEHRVHFALEAHGFLLTHAGLAKAFKQQRCDPEVKTDVNRFVQWCEESNEARPVPGAWIGVRDAISGYRGGGANAGGILWRDAREKLYPEFRQIFGHTAKDGKIRRYPSNHGMSYCIDIGTPMNGRLAGIWLPSEEIVKVHVPQETVLDIKARIR